MHFKMATTTGLASIISRPPANIQKSEIVKDPKNFDQMEELQDSREVTSFQKKKFQASTQVYGAGAPVKRKRRTPGKRRKKKSNIRKKQKQHKRKKIKKNRKTNKKRKTVKRRTNKK